MSLDRDTFRSPPVEYRSGPLWVWNDEMEEPYLSEQIGEMADRGWGAFFMHPRYGLSIEYGSEEWMRKIRYSVERARDEGIDPWLYDEYLWPSGYGGGDVPGKGDEYRIKALLLRDRPDPDDDVLSAVERDDGVRYICRASLDADQYAGASGDAYADLMNPDAVAEFVDVTYERYADAVGDEFGDVIPGVFTDEPQIGFPGKLGGDVAASVPWTADLPALFEEEYGYDLLDHLPCLFYDEDAGDWEYRSVRYDFWRLVTTRFVETYTGRIAEWCESNDLELTGHYLLEDAIETQIPANGAVMPHYEYEHMPGIDFLGRAIGGNGTALAAKQASSAARQFDRTAMSELYGCSGQQFPARVRKWIGDWHLAHGITFLNHHLSLYSMRGERKRDYPPNIFYQQPWWSYNDRIADYFARVVYALRQGDALADTLLVHPVQTGWLHYDGGGQRSTPEDGRRDARGVSELDDEFAGLIDALLAAHVNFDLGDEMLLEKYAEVDESDARLRVEATEYDTVVVPFCRTLQSTTVALLTDFVESGGTVLTVGDPPERVDGRIDDGALDGLLSRATRQADPEEVVSRAARPVRFLDRTTGAETAAAVRVHARRLEDDSLLVFAANTSRSERYEATVRFEGTGALERWDPLDGTSEQVAVTVDGDETRTDVSVSPYESLLLRFDPSARNREGVDGISLTRPFPADEELSLADADWTVRRHDPNALVVDRCHLVLNGDDRGDVNVAEGWIHPHRLDDPDEHVPFEATYAVEVDRSVAGSDLSVVVESAREVDVAVNGRPVSGEGERWRDPHWRRFDVSEFVRGGANEVTVSGVRSETVSVEPIFVLGEFAVPDAADDHRLVSEFPLGSPETITDEGYPFFTGELTLETSIDLDGGATGRLRFDEVHASLARVRVNGGEWTDLLWPPWDAPITLTSGENCVEVRLVTSLRNLTGPHHAAEVEPEAVSPYTFRGVDADEWYDGYRVVPVGIENPRVRLDDD